MRTKITQMEYSFSMPELSGILKLKVSRANRGGRGLESGARQEQEVERDSKEGQPKEEKLGQLGVVGGELGWAEGGGEPMRLASGPA